MKSTTDGPNEVLRGVAQLALKAAKSSVRSNENAWRLCLSEREELEDVVSCAVVCSAVPRPHLFTNPDGTLAPARVYRYADKASQRVADALRRRLDSLESLADAGVQVGDRKRDCDNDGDVNDDLARQESLVDRMTDERERELQEEQLRIWAVSARARAWRLLRAYVKTLRVDRGGVTAAVLIGRARELSYGEIGAELGLEPGRRTENTLYRRYERAYEKLPRELRESGLLTPPTEKS